jgi:hypothetical protein
MPLKGIRERERKKLIRTRIVLIKLLLLSLIPELKLLAISLITLATRKDTCPGIRGALSMRIKSGITPKKLKLKKTLLLQIAI